ncbi:zinc-binding dehydrogenase [Tissierella sp.]|uniref:zinc-binding dehydrogenase n=1 Tax=Tissierella sp. TaxID=41274 RepID=UPI0028596174|nr:zinc-binding dehydrogenase [Tissierella sp.]MDR7857664.1 zinc-binding dehydrogenase [Tissierella sp.]
MKGWQFTTTHEPLTLIKKEDPIAKEGYVVLDVMATGLCHSDVGALEDEGWLGLITKRPCILGHEFAGVISEIGPGVEGYKVGDKVGVCPMFASDGTGPSYGRDGGYATKSAVPAEMLVPVPEGVNFAEAAAATDAGMTSYHAVVNIGKVEAGMKVGMIGIGGLGQIGARIAVLKGCEVYASSRNPVAREKALALGCKEVVESVDQLAQFDLDVIIDFAGSGESTAQALEVVKKRGRVVVVGMAKLETTLNIMTLITKQAEVVGSNGGSAQDIAEVYKLIASGDLQPEIIEIGFDEIAEGLDKLKDGGIKGRMVAMIKDEDR